MYIGRLSEEFGGALPSVIEAELDRLPVGFLERVIEYRAYAAAKSRYDGATTKPARDALRSNALVDLVETITFGVVQAQLTTP